MIIGFVWNDDQDQYGWLRPFYSRTGDVEADITLFAEKYPENIYFLCEATPL